MQFLQQRMLEQAGALPAHCSALRLGIAACTCGLALANSVREVRSTCAGSHDKIIRFVSLPPCFTECAPVQNSASQTLQEFSTNRCAWMMLHACRSWPSHHELLTGRIVQCPHRAPHSERFTSRCCACPGAVSSRSQRLDVRAAPPSLCSTLPVFLNRLDHVSTNQRNSDIC